MEEAPTDLDWSPWTGVRETAPKRAGDDEPRRWPRRTAFAMKSSIWFTSTWEEFCEKHQLISRRSVDRNIRRLKEFGRVFFRLAEAVPIASGEYRLIRGHVIGADGGGRGVDPQGRDRHPSHAPFDKARTVPRPYGSPPRSSDLTGRNATASPDHYRIASPHRTEARQANDRTILARRRAAGSCGEDVGAL
jgi:hypothetical protein